MLIAQGYPELLHYFTTTSWRLTGPRPPQRKTLINIKQSEWTVRHLVLSLDFSRDFVKLKSSGPLFGRYRRHPGNQSLSFPDDSIASQKGKHPPLRNNQPFWCQTQLLQHPTSESILFDPAVTTSSWNPMY